MNQTQTKTLLSSLVEIGCDPEVFVTDLDGNVVGSERVIPDAIPAGRYTKLGHTIHDAKEVGRDAEVVRDGVQLELHPIPTTCRANTVNSLAGCFRALAAHFAGLETQYKLSFDPCVRVSTEELKRLSESSRTLGCLPSFNLYGLAPLNVNGAYVEERFTGGHIHIGCNFIKHEENGRQAGKMDELGVGMATNASIRPERVVRLLDIVGGTIITLLDRHPDAAKRRLQYGRAGEYRLPKHGLEWRTPSAFWLQAPVLFSLLAGVCQMVTDIAYTETQKDGYSRNSNTAYYQRTIGFDVADQLDQLVSIDETLATIQENSFSEALKVWEKIRPILRGVSYGKGVDSNTIEDFEYFIATGGVEKWFSGSPFPRWLNAPEGHGTGWETFAEDTLRKERLAKKWTNPFSGAPQAPAVPVGDVREGKQTAATREGAQ